MTGLYALPPGVDFAAELVRGLEARCGDPVALARTEVWVNTARTRRRLTEVFDAGPARLLPKIRLVTELGRLVQNDVPPGLSPLARRLELRQLVVRLIEAEPDIAPRSSAYDLADSLALLFVEMADEGVTAADLARLDVADASGHWQRSLKFLAIASQIAQDPDTAALQRSTVEALVGKWRNRPPTDPIVLAGSTGSRGPVARLIRYLVSSGRGSVVLPGFDFHMDAADWAAIRDAPQAEDHPQYRYARLLGDLSLSPDDVRRWTDAAPPAPARGRLLSMALRPAPVTDSWLRDGPALGALGPACATMTLIEAPSPRVEALAIALRLRRAAEDGVRAALITPDRTLARRVRAALDRWRIEPDDSAGTALGDTAPGRLTRMVARMMGRPVAARDLAACLAHPLVAAGSDRRAHLDLARRFEVRLRKEFVHTVSDQYIADWASGNESRGPWATWVSSIASDISARPPAHLGALCNWHISLVQRLFSGPDGVATDELWKSDAGEALQTAFADLALAAEFAGPFGATDYVALIESLLGQIDVRSAERPHPSVMIWGTLEARVQTVDVAILGGLNEGTWPRLPEPDPWLSRGMRTQAGLLSPERRIGLSAHDFQSAAGAAELILSRAIRDDDALAVPSRWINRLTNLLAGLPRQGGDAALDAMRARGQKWIDMARAIEVPAGAADPAPRPSVAPPPNARPRRLSVTQIATLIRDPYAIYAREVLGLMPLPPLGQAADARLRGTLLHRIFERFLRSSMRNSAHLSVQHLLGATDEALSFLADQPALRAQWAAAVRRIAGPFVAAEKARWQRAVPAWLEVRGELDFVLPDASGFRLVGVADRVDRADDGQAAIYDYKSGHVPTAAEQTAFDKQLFMLALMAEAGAYGDPDPIPPFRVFRVGYLGVGSRISENFLEIDPDILSDFRDRLLTLLAAYRQPDRGYTSRAMPKREDDRGDYDQLARYGEWSNAALPLRIRVGRA